MMAALRPYRRNMVAAELYDRGRSPLPSAATLVCTLPGTGG
jgi:hypothetical protein